MKGNDVVLVKAVYQHFLLALACVNACFDK